MNRHRRTMPISMRKDGSMHELGIAQEVVAIVAEHAGPARVKRVVLEIGRHAMILPDSIRFCFDLCSEGTAAQGAELEIREVPARARCRECGEEVVLEQPFGLCVCGSSDLQWLAGDEIKVKEMEIV
jgi:hydrogenase nickel incorporation protein HypA/HybF